MKKTVLMILGLVLVASILAPAGHAANSLKQGAIGLNVDVTDDYVISGKYFILKDLAVLGGFGLGMKGGDAKGTDVGIGAGARKYLKTDDLAPFVGGEFFYSSTNDSNNKAYRVMGVFGAEVFLHKEFSVEGSVGLGYTSQETKTGTGAAATKTKETNFGTSRFGLSVNFYF